MTKIILTHTITGEAREYEAVDRDYILMLARLINIEEAEELLLNKHEELKKNNRIDLCIDLLDGKVKLREMEGKMVKGFNTMIPILSCDQSRGEVEFTSWIDDELEHLGMYLDNVYAEVC